jgi:membrane-bound inhibitor of C-type lysozyme
MRHRPICGVLVVIGVVSLSTAASAQRFIAYECSDGTQFQAAIIDRDKTAYLQLDGHSYTLPKKIAYTGNRYAKGGVTYWVRGNGRVTVKRARKVSECFSVTAPGRG